MKKLFFCILLLGIETYAQDIIRLRNHYNRQNTTQEIESVYGNQKINYQEYQHGFRDGYDQALYERSRDYEKADEIAIKGIMYGLFNTAWKDGVFSNPITYLPSDMRYRPQRYFQKPTYTGMWGSPNGMLNRFDQLRNCRNYRRTQAPTIRANPPINYGWRRY